jgi:capsular exopolysaccharide synthesis family protein
MAGQSTGAVHHHVTQDPAAILAESLRSLRVSLRLRGESGRRQRVVAFTSTLPDEGKTSLAVMLGMIAAKSGERVCIVDCDLRRPSLHKAFSIGNARGLADYLSDRLSLDEVIHRKDPSGVHLITAKAVPSYSLTLLTSGRMERLIGLLREQYDLVILDAPSSLAFADARVLARMADQTLYVVAWNRTRRDSVLASLKAYADMNYADLALVLNKVDLSEYLRDSAAAVIYQYGQEHAVPA